MEVFDIIIIGAGVVGSACGYYLARAGAQVLLVDRHDPGRATDAGAGIISPESSTAYGAAWMKLALAAAEEYPNLIADLESQTGLKTGYARCGHLLVAVSEDEKAVLDQLGSSVRGAAPAGIAPAEARLLFPPLGEIQAARYIESGARVDGQRLAAAMQRAAAGLGLTIHQAGCLLYTSDAADEN